jgi:ribosomal protein S18 acetylase RimI-like enzyme
LKTENSSTELPDFLRVDRVKACGDLNHQDLEQILSVGNSKLARQRMQQRFDRKASLWTIKWAGNLAGFGWTLRGGAIDLYYFPIGSDDVQFFDFHVLPKYRGRALDWFLFRYILNSLAAEGGARAFAEAAEWNQPSVASLNMIGFRCLGRGRILRLFGQTLTSWAAGAGLGSQKAGRRQAASVQATSESPYVEIGG